MNVTSDGERAIKDWLAAKERHEQARRDENRASCDESNAETALVKWMLPPDAKPGEKIAVWFGDSLIQVEVGGEVIGQSGETRAMTSTKVTVRHRGKHFGDLR